MSTLNTQVNLDELCVTRMDSIGVCIPFPLCLALLVSAASVSGRPPSKIMGQVQSFGSGKRSGVGSTSQLSVLVIQNPHDPILINR